MSNLTFKDLLKDRFSAKTSEELFQMVEQPVDTCPSIDFIQNYLQNIAVLKSANSSISKLNRKFLYIIMFEQLESLRILIMDLRARTKDLKSNIWEHGTDPSQGYFKENIIRQLDSLHLSFKKFNSLYLSLNNKYERIKKMIPIELDESDFHAAWSDLFSSAEQLEYWSKSWQEIGLIINQGLNPFNRFKN